MIRNATPSDATALADIYNHYILNTVVTFEEERVSPLDMADRVVETHKAGLPYLVYESEKGVIGYAYASKWKGRCAYRHSVEVSVYLTSSATGKGLGSALYTQLISRLKDLGYHVLIGGISLPNPASITLHERFGFKPVGVFTEVGFKFEKWVDVGYWQLVIKD